LTVAVGRGAQMGVLFKGGEALERLAHVDAIVLDKTGTLTVGKPVLEKLNAIEGAREQGSEGARKAERDLLRMAAAAEERSNHPLAQGLARTGRLFRRASMPQARASKSGDRRHCGSRLAMLDLCPLDSCHIRGPHAQRREG